MKQTRLLTGRPGVGKTTLIRQAISGTARIAGGFYTREIRAGTQRQGFEIVTLDGPTAILSHVDFHSPHRVGKYGVNVDNLNSLGVAALRRAIEECELVVVDEIGKMELFSLPFRESVLEAIKSGKKVLGTIMLQPHPWADQIKRDARVEVLTVTRASRQHVQELVQAWLRE
jgi:nucleoside-triphosphatase